MDARAKARPTRKEQDMQLARVIGNVVATVKAPEYSGHRLLLVRPEGADGEPTAQSYIAVDLVDAGPGDRVLLMREGSSVRDLIGNENAPIHAAVVGIVDEVAK
jgi:ethanolamine utilization protein EutN